MSSNFINFDMLQGVGLRQSNVYNVNTSHPLIPNSQEYAYYKKYISIHSEDRDIIKYPNSSSFEIELPEDLLNIYTARLSEWSFPANYSTFSSINSNVTMTFKINNPFQPSSQGYSVPLYDEIYNCLFLLQNSNFTITIEDGFYNPDQMATELTNKFNYAVTVKVREYFSDTSTSYYNSNTFPNLLTEFNANGGYTNFIVVYNIVSQKIWFGNTTDGFVLTNSTYVSNNLDNISEPAYCYIKKQLPDSSNWGLASNLGLPPTDVSSSNDSSSTLNGSVVTPRFYYGDVTPGDNGYWLMPNSILPGSTVYWIECPFKINLMGPSYFYMEIEGLNCINETSPYNVSTFTATTNETNGIVNSAFAKIAIPTTPLSQWFDRDSNPYKIFIPPAERMRKIKIKLRYHNGQLVDFGLYNYSFVLEFALMVPQQLRNSKTYGVNFKPAL